MPEIHCRHFNGFKPCSKNTICDSTCRSRSLVGSRILVVHLEALGAVLRSTSLLAAIKRKYPAGQITWVTKAPAHLLLQNLPGVDRVLTLAQDDLLKLKALNFDAALVIDKSILAAGVVAQTQVKRVFGFVADQVTGAIVPATPDAEELWQIGLSNQKKFFENKKTEQHLVHQALELGRYTHDEYQIQLSNEEQGLVRVRRGMWSGAGQICIGINTGCSPVIPYKKLSLGGHRRLIEEILNTPQFKNSQIVLLGGPEDTERNEAIASGLPVFLSPTQRGLRDGLVSVAACDLVFSGDSLGMHMAIGLKKWVVAWFGPTCPQEIDLYGRGRKIHSSAPCAPCWKRVCHKGVMCYDQLDFAAVVKALQEGLEWLTLSSKPHFPATSFSPSPY